MSWQERDFPMITMNKNPKKVVVFGIDGAFPEYVFGEWIDELPNIKKLMKEGAYARLNSTIPPLSVVAWTSITTGKHPADTGIFEYVYRKNHFPTDTRIVSSRNLTEKTIWQIASENSMKSTVGYLILTWPIISFNGNLICGTLSPDGKDAETVYPAELKKELNSLFGEIPGTDVPNFRNISDEETAEKINKLTKKQLEIAKYLLKNKEWDLFFWVVGVSDRMNHTFWKYIDREHRKYEPYSKFKDTLKNYYKLLDSELGEIIESAGKDTVVIVLSDHGIMRLHTRIKLTDWLIKEGYMVLKKPATEKLEFDFSMVDWKKTKAFAIGAYEGQIFINLKGREPEGIVEKEEYDALIEEIISGLGKIRGDKGECLNNRFFKKKEYFHGKCERIAPDLIVYFDNLQYGCDNTLVGNETLYGERTAKGPGDTGHSMQGIFIIKNGKCGGDLGEVSYLDVAPTILSELGIKIPDDMTGRIIGGKNGNLSS